MTFECDYCHSILKTKYSLNTHLKTNKKCLALQFNKIEYKYECDNCIYKTNEKQKINQHKNHCHFKIQNKKKSEILRENEIKMNSLEIKLDENKNILKEKDKQIEDYKKQIQTLQETIAKIAEQPKIVNQTNNNNTNQITKNTLHQDLHLTLNLDKDIVKKTVEEKYTLGHYYKGSEGVAKFCYDNILCNEKGECKAGIADANRGTIKYKNNAGNIVKDPGCTTLIDLLYPPVIDKSTKFLKSEMEKHMKIMEEKGGMERVNAEAMNQYNQLIFLEIKEMQNNKIKKFRDPLIKQVLNKDNTFRDIVPLGSQMVEENNKLLVQIIEEKSLELLDYKKEENVDHSGVESCGVEEYKEKKEKKEKKVYRTIAEEIEDVPQEIIDRDNRILDEIDKQSKYVNKNKKWKK
jgi:hypothetical protein